MGEHHNLQAIIAHMSGKISINFYHGLAEMRITTDSQDALAVGIPIRESLHQQLFIPGKEKLGKFMVVNSIGIGGISNPDVNEIGNVTSIFQIKMIV